MTRFHLPENYIDNLEAILRRKRSRTVSPHASLPLLPIDDLVNPASSATTAMAKTLCDYFVPNDAEVPIGPAINTRARNFKLHTGLTTRNVFINDESLMTLTIFVTELGHLMTKLVASSWLTSDGALARRIMTKMETTSVIIETKSS